MAWQVQRVLVRRVLVRRVTEQRTVRFTIERKDSGPAVFLIPFTHLRAVTDFFSKRPDSEKIDLPGVEQTGKQELLAQNLQAVKK
jgi:hypothetical protein